MGGPGDRGWLAANIPVPEAHLAGIALLLALHRARPAPLPLPPAVRRGLGAGLVGAGAGLAAHCVAVAGAVDLARPRALVTTGPYAVSRNPMYVAWAAIHLGVGLLSGSAWAAVTLGAAAWRVDREVRREEARLAAAFGTRYELYRRTVPRYVGGSRRGRLESPPLKSA